MQTNNNKIYIGGSGGKAFWLAEREALCMLTTLAHFDFTVYCIFGNGKYLQICYLKEVPDDVFSCNPEVHMTFKIKVKNSYRTNICGILCFKIDHFFGELYSETKTNMQILPIYLQNLTVTRLALHAGLIVYCTKQMPFLEIKGTLSLVCVPHDQVTNVMSKNLNYPNII